MGKRFIGVLPAAGVGSRLRPFRYPKELLPVTYQQLRKPFSGLRPRVVSEFALETLANAGMKDCIIVIAPWKVEIQNYFGDGRNFGVNIGYAYQEQARGLPAAIDLAYPWVRDHYVMFAMPDTIVRPLDYMTRLREFFESTNADLALGIFPSKEAARLGPVLTAGDTVITVYDKCKEPPVMNTWGGAIWGPRFSEFLHSELMSLPEGGSEPVLGMFFDLAVRNGYRVRGLEFSNGSYADIGTPQGIRQCLDLPYSEDGFHAAEEG